ncbi:hypothetical protein B5M09_003229 [Aphanomyces astaci]|uniref:N-acetylglucosamine-6-phosphate deacetylase n=1 Tax=Aphanomyces astaci TaxID=112090 RepID=A0A3R7VYQ6_APHAT|nr:hypothetical protein B5M09_003229 [Aphanomyces astaci]
MNDKTVKVANVRLLRGGKLTNTFLWIENGKVADPQARYWRSQSSAEYGPREVVDGRGLILAPGFVDIQLNGAYGHDFSDVKCTEADVLEVRQKLLATGVTSFCPTVISSAPSTYARVLSKFRRTSDGHLVRGANMVGLHLEGPFINRQRKGAHKEEVLLDPVDGLASLEAVYGPLSRDTVALVTLAPELKGASLAISQLVERGIVASAGHSSATIQEAVAGVGAGISMLTHLFNAMASFHHRDPGLVGLLGATECPRPSYGLILDGIHAHATSCRIAQASHPDGLILVTDCMAGMGLPDGSYVLADLPVDVQGGRAYLHNTQTIAGSVVQMDTCVRTLRQYTDCSIEYALEAASLHPARALGLRAKGSLEFGADADFVLLTDDLRVVQTYIAGVLVYDRLNELDLRVPSQNNSLDAAVLQPWRLTAFDLDDVRALDKAASVGDLALVKQLQAHANMHCTTDAMDDAAGNGHLEVVKFLHQHRSEGCTTRAMDYAAARGHVDVLQFLHEYRSEGCTAYAMTTAKANGHGAVVRYLQEHQHSVCLNDVRLTGDRAEDREKVLASLSPGSSEFHYFRSIQLLHELNVDDAPDADDKIEEILNHVKSLEQDGGWQRARRLRLRLNIVLLEHGRESAREFFVDTLGLELNTVRPPEATSADVGSSQQVRPSTLSYDIEGLKQEKIAKVKKCLYLQDDKWMVPYKAESFLRQLSPFVLQALFESLNSPSGLPDWTPPQKKLVLQFILQQKLLLWTDFDSFVDAVAKDILDIYENATGDNNKVQVFGGLAHHNDLNLTQLDVLWDRCSTALHDNTPFALRYVQLLQATKDNERQFLSTAVTWLKQLGPQVNGVRVVLLHRWLQLIYHDKNEPTLGSLFLQYVEIPREECRIANEDMVRNADYDSVVRFVNTTSSAFGRPQAETASKPLVSTLATALGYSVDLSSDEDLIKTVFALLVQRGSTIQDFAPYLSLKFLKAQYATAMLTCGRGSRGEYERDIVDPCDVHKLFQGSEVSFCKSNPSSFAPDDPVSLVLNVKNIQALTIQLFEINVSDHYLKTFRAIPSDISLDGLLPNDQVRVRFDHVPSHVRVQHRVEFPSMQLSCRGVFVVEVVGQDIACRAVVRKGGLHFTQEITSHGHELTVFDEASNVVLGCVAVVPDVQDKAKKHHSFSASEDGRIIVPFYTAVDEHGLEPVKRASPIYIGHGSYGTLGTFTYCEESYKLKANIYIDSEQLVPGTKATVLIRSKLYVHGCPTSTSLVRNVVLSVAFVSQTNIETKKEIRQLPLMDDANELVTTIDIPHEAVSFKVTLKGDVASKDHGDTAAATTSSSLSTARVTRLCQVSDSKHFDIPHPTRDDVLFNPHLKKVPNGNGDEDYVVLMLGHNGEGVPNVEATIELRHLALESPISCDVVSNHRGEVFLGPLTHVVSIDMDVNGRRYAWNLPNWALPSWSVAGRQSHVTQCAMSTKDVLIPVPHVVGKDLQQWIESGAISVLKIYTVQSRTIRQRADRPSFVCVGPGSSLLFKPSSVGEFEVVVKPINATYRIHVGESQVAGFVKAAPSTLLKADPTAPVVVRNLHIVDHQLKIFGVNTTPNTRAQVILRRFVSHEPVTNVLNEGMHDENADLRRFDVDTPTCEYFESKRIGDEYAYILERRAFAVQHPSSKLHQGNRLTLPSLLLNPFKVKETSGSTLADAKQGEEYGKSRGDDSSMPKKSKRMGDRQRSSTRGGHSTSSPVPPNTLFLEAPSCIMSNIRLNSLGEVTVALPSTLTGSYDVVVSLVDGQDVDSRQQSVVFHPRAGAPAWAMPLKSTALSRDAALGVDKDVHSIQVRGHRCIASSDATTLPCGPDSKLEVYDCLEHAFGLLDALTGHDVLYNEYLKRWPSLDLPTKQAIYSQDVSNELNLFLYKKDTDFFNAVVVPHVRSKFVKDFVDWYLLDAKNVLLHSYFSNAATFDKLTLVEKLLLAERLPKEDAATVCRHVVRIIETYYGESTGTKLDAVFEHVMTAKSTEQSDLVQYRQHDDSTTPAYSPTSPAYSPTSPAYSPTSSAPVPTLNRRMVAFRMAPQRASMEATVNRDRVLQSATIGGGATFGAMRAFAAPPPAPYARDNDDEDSDSGSDDDDSWENISHDGDDGDIDERATTEPTTKKQRKVYVAPGATYLVGERRYHDGKDEPQQPGGGLVATLTAVQQKTWVGSAINRFWLDYARYLLSPSSDVFLSASFPEACSSFAEATLALSVLGLPFVGGAWEVQPITARDHTSLAIRTSKPVIVYYEDIRAQQPSPQELTDEVAMVGSNLIVTQTIFNPRDSNLNQGQLKPVKEFVRSTRYGCQVTVSNLSPQATPSLNLLVQIPEGAIPVSTGGYYTRNSTFVLAGNETDTTVVYFYFPVEGSFSHFAAHVAIHGQTVRWADESPMTTPSTISVVAESKTVDITSWKDVSSRGSLDTLVTFLKTHRKLETIDWEAMAWRLKDRSTYDVLLHFLREHFVYTDVVWQFSFFFNDQVAMADLLQRRLSAYKVGPGLSFPKLLPLAVFNSTDSRLVADVGLEHAEYIPLIFRRTHGGVKDTDVIPNKDVRDAYRVLCHTLCLLPKLDDDHYLVLVYYMVLLNRIDSALELFGRVSASAATTIQLQYDYMNGFLDFFRDDPTFPIARAVASKYATAPYVAHHRWGALFQRLQDQLHELDSLAHHHSASILLPEQDVSLELTMSEGSFVVTQRGSRVDKCIVKYYPVDVEVMFSREPFSGQDAKVSSCISLIQPRATAEISVSAGGTTTVAVPPALHATQMLVVVSPVGYPEMEMLKPHFCDSMDVHFALDEGLVQVFAHRRPLGKAYVKVFVQTKSSKLAKFYKDGYTDICGRFDYMGINDTALLLDVAKVALLILHPRHGAVIRQVSPPTTISLEGDHRPVQRDWTTY